MSITSKVLHKRSNRLSENAPQQPSEDSLDYGEIAINYAADNERLFIKNSGNKLVDFRSNDAIEKTISSTATKLNEDLGDRIQAVKDAVENKADSSTVTTLTNTVDNKIVYNFSMQGISQNDPSNLIITDIEAGQESGATAHVWQLAKKGTKFSTTEVALGYVSMPVQQTGVSENSVMSQAAVTNAINDAQSNAVNSANDFTKGEVETLNNTISTTKTSTLKEASADAEKQVNALGKSLGTKISDLEQGLTALNRTHQTDITALSGRVAEIVSFPGFDTNGSAATASHSDHTHAKAVRFTTDSATDVVDTNSGSDGFMQAADKFVLSHMMSVKYVTSTENIPTSSRNVFVELTSDTVSNNTLSVTFREASNGLWLGSREMNIIIHNNTNMVLSIACPDQIYRYEAMCTNSEGKIFSIEQGKYGEINIITARNPANSAYSFYCRWAN